MMFYYNILMTHEVYNLANTTLHIKNDITSVIEWPKDLYCHFIEIRL
jgi:hypothetical protein